jgi:hypothetical protein
MHDNGVDQPIFVDPTGRRVRGVRVIMALLAVAVVGCLGMLGLSVVTDVPLPGIVKPITKPLTEQFGNPAPRPRPVTQSDADGDGRPDEDP